MGICSLCRRHCCQEEVEVEALEEAGGRGGEGKGGLRSRWRKSMKSEEKGAYIIVVG